MPMGAAGAATPVQPATNHQAANPFFPKTSIVRFDAANPQAILGKNLSPG